jgi:hypothetical protein
MVNLWSHFDPSARTIYLSLMKSVGEPHAFFEVLRPQSQLEQNMVQLLRFPPEIGEVFFN